MLEQKQKVVNDLSVRLSPRLEYDTASGRLVVMEVSFCTHLMEMYGSFRT